MAPGTGPAGYKPRPEIGKNVVELTAYLQSAQKTQPLDNRLILLWASTKLRHVLPEAERQSILDQVWQKQQQDGGWTLESLGAWKQRANAPPATGSSSYATRLGGFILQPAAVRRTTPAFSPALRWLH